ISFNGMSQCIDATVGRHFGGAGNSEQRVYDCDAWTEIIAQYADLDVIVGVGEDRSSRNLGPRPRRGRHADQGPDRPRNLIIPDVVPWHAPVSEDGRSNLGQVHVAPAAQTEHSVRLER